MMFVYQILDGSCSLLGAFEEQDYISGHDLSDYYTNSRLLRYFIAV
jgi:hypothetical protein